MFQNFINWSWKKDWTGDSDNPQDKTIESVESVKSVQLVKYRHKVTLIMKDGSEEETNFICSTGQEEVDTMVRWMTSNGIFHHTLTDGSREYIRPSDIKKIKVHPNPTEV
jgi:hypothetical protein